MGYFSNGTEGLAYQERFCFTCAHWDYDTGCPVWNLHEFHNNEDGWKRALDKLIPRDTRGFNEKCVTYRRDDQPKEAPLTPGQRKGLEEWRRAKSAVNGAAQPRRRREIDRIDL